MDPQSPPYVTIIDAYLEGRLPVEAAAQELLAALRAAPRPVNLGISPKMRPLFAEMHRLTTGRVPPTSPPYAADPKRHESGNLRLLAGVEASFWETLRKYDHPTRLDCSFHAANEAAARGLADWLTARGHTVTVRTPVDADQDDWVVHGTSASKQWTRELLADWVRALRSAPLHGVASIMGVGVLQT